jgi:olfactory receptor
MAIDRFVNICKTLQYPSIITKFVVKSTVYMTLRNTLDPISVPVLAAQRSRNQIEHCLSSNLGVTSLSCDDRKINRINQRIMGWAVMGVDLGLTILSYILVLQSVMKLNSVEAASKALGTCTSHLILILFFHIILMLFPSLTLQE